MRNFPPANGTHGPFTGHTGAFFTSSRRMPEGFRTFPAICSGVRSKAGPKPSLRASCAMIQRSGFASPLGFTASSDHWTKWVRLPASSVLYSNTVVAGSTMSA